MCSDGFLNMYSLPELKLVCREDCVDASDAFGQRNFTITSRGLFVHLRSPSEFTRGSVAEQARMDLHFSIPTKSTSKLALPYTTTKSISKDQLCDVSPSSPMLRIRREVKWCYKSAKKFLSFKILPFGLQYS